VKDVIGDIDRPLEKPVRYLVPHPATWKNYSCCPWAKTVIAIDPETDTPVVCPVTCKRWGCEYCAVRKIRKLAFLTNGATPNRWIRLGVQPRNYNGPRDAWEKTSPMVPEWRRLMKKQLGCDLEYLRVTELHQSGFPHYHALLRSGFLPVQIVNNTWADLTALPIPKDITIEAAAHDLGNRQYDVKKLLFEIDRDPPKPDAKKPKPTPEQIKAARIRRAWNDCTGSSKNWIAKIDSTFSSFRYLVKYLTKLHKIEWTDRHVSYSRDFFRPEDREKLAFPERSIVERSDEHPWLYLSRRYDRNTVGVDDNGCYHLNELYCGTPKDMDRADVGLPMMKEPEPPPPPKHVQTAIFPDSNVPTYEDASY
jgi:hypothetical protein